MNAKSLLIASAVAMIFVTGAVNARADQSAGTDQVKCVGVNSCRDKGPANLSKMTARAITPARTGFRAHVHARMQGQGRHRCSAGQ